MNNTGSIARRRTTLTAGDLRDHLKNMNETTPLVIELPDGRRMNIRAASDPKSTDLPFVILLAADDYSAVALGM